VKISAILPQLSCAVRVEGDPRSYLRVKFRDRAVWYKLTSVGYELVNWAQTEALEEAFLGERQHHVMVTA